MKLPVKDRLLSWFGVLALAAILVVLAVLQYRWSRELNDAASDRMRAGLHSSMVGLREDMNREFAGLGLALQPGPPVRGAAESADSYVDRLESWKRTASHPAMVAGIYVLENANEADGRLLRLNTSTRRFEAVEWPAQFSDLRDNLRRFSTEMWDVAKHIPEGPPRLSPPAPQDHHGVHHFPPKMTPWAIDQAVPAVVHAEIVANGARHEKVGLNWLIVQLDQDVIGRAILPELTQKYFGGPDGLIYDVAVIAERPERHSLYSSNSQLGMSEPAAVDGRIYLFGPPNGPGMQNHEPGSPANAAALPGEREWHGFGHGGSLRLESFRRAGSDAAWVLVAKHRKGSLEAALASMRRRHMAISFGILLMLAVALGMIVATTRRAQRLAKLQMDFVAGVSHELRTPLAVISSAADNIAEGIIDDKRRVARYGEVIRNQSRQLSHLVEQILLFAATRHENHHYNLTRVCPDEIIKKALANSAELIRTSGITVQQDVGSELPLVLVDLSAATHCVQNLVTNAVKYGGDTRWIGIRGRVVRDGSPREVQISVEDKGIGIQKSELQRIFDPFYRSPAVVGAEIHGTGLGLALAKAVAEAMGGRLTVSSKPGEGSVFMLYLPCAPDTAEIDESPAMAASGQSSIADR